MAIVCPYCLNDLTVHDLHRHCNICNGKMSINLKNSILLKSGTTPSCSSTPGCLGHYSIIRCGKCGTVLPSTIAQYDKYIRFSTVAPSGAGKSNFITTMIEELKKNRSLSFLVTPMDSETQILHENNTKKIYEEFSPVPGTRPGDIVPMQWSIKDMKKMTQKAVPAYSMTIFDGAGELQERIDPKICRYIAGSKMIMLLLDPTQLYGVRTQMTEDEINKAGGQRKNVTREETKKFLYNIIKYLKTTCSVGYKKRIDIPVAVVFGKLDAVAHNLGSARVLSGSVHAAKGAFVQSEADAIHNEIEGWMDVCGDNLTKIFNENFTKWRYFGVSSFGILPIDRDTLQKPTPLRVLDPLIWNLALEGIVPIVK